MNTNSDASAVLQLSTYKLGFIFYASPSFQNFVTDDNFFLVVCRCFSHRNKTNRNSETEMANSCLKYFIEFECNWNIGGSDFPSQSEYGNGIPREDEMDDWTKRPWEAKEISIDEN